MSAAPVCQGAISSEAVEAAGGAVFKNAGDGCRAAFPRRGICNSSGSWLGDGFLATFDGPARAIRCALSIRDDVRSLGLEIRAGVHTGEVELIDGDIGGIGGHIGARVVGEAGPSEVLVSRPVKDLVAGSGIAFADRGPHHLEGVPDEWRLFAAE